MSKGKRQAARLIVDLFSESIRGADAGPALVRLIAELRPFLRDAMREAGVSSGAPDNARMATYIVSLKVWDGPDSNDPELFGEADAETVQGFEEVVSLVVEWLQELHAEDGFSAEDMAAAGVSCAGLWPRIPGLRSMLSRQGGTTTLRVPYELGGRSYLASAPITRPSD